MTGPLAGERLSALLSEKRDYLREIKDLAGRSRYVVFYGAGTVFERMLGAWRRYVGRKVDFCCDGDRRKWGTEIDGIKCVSPAELLAMKDDCAVFVTAGAQKKVFEELGRAGLASARPLYKYDLASAATGPLPPEGTRRKLEEVRALLADERSLNVFDAVVRRVLDRRAEPGLMEDVCEGDQYFPADLVKLSGDESFVDAGAFDGDSVKDIAARTGGEFGKIFSFELDARNFEALRRSVDAMPGRERVKIFNLGLWDGEGEVRYSSGDPDSAVGDGPDRGRVTRLDAALKGEKVTYVKMDIEGAEPRALLGARGIIREQRPTLAVCVYHDFRHLWEVPLLIRELAPDYRIYLRHHSPLEYETVCYAVPGKL